MPPTYTLPISPNWRDREALSASTVSRERVKQEKAGLDLTLANLTSFLRTAEFPALDTTSQMLLIDQRHAMEMYSDILRRRLLHGVALGQSGAPGSRAVEMDFDELTTVGPVEDGDPPFFGN